jgi:hypothetical protein
MDRKKTVDDLVLINNIFISVVDPANLDILIEGLPSESRIFTTNESRKAVMGCLGQPGIYNRLFDLSQYNMDSGGDDFGGFGKKIAVGTLFRKYEIADQRVKNMERVAPLNLLVINFGHKKMTDFSRDDLAALNLLDLGIANFSRVMILSDVNDYVGFVKRLNTKKKVTTGKSDRVLDIYGNTDIRMRFLAAQKAAAMKSRLLSDFSLSSLENELKKYELFLKSGLITVH